jgi:hypothetical protein
MGVYNIVGFPSVDSNPTFPSTPRFDSPSIALLGIIQFPS